MFKEFAKLEKHFSGFINADIRHYRFFAPGRVNLLGEYTDFNGGLVLPCAIQLGTYLFVQENQSRDFRFFSTNCPEQLSISLDILQKTEEKDADWSWANYPIALLKLFYNGLSELKHGLDFFFLGTIPLASGLSSSASIEVLSAFALNTILNTNYTLSELALLAQKAENEFVGVQCGIMDQYSIALGKEGHALKIDCQMPEHELIPMKSMEEHVWLIINSNKKRQLSESQYNERRQECQMALDLINKQHHFSYLCQFPEQKLKELHRLIDNDTLYRRALHVIEEHYRVIDGAEFLKEGKLSDFGSLMNASHQSLSRNFEVSGEILDSLVDITRKQKGVLGSRMTGAGFGGCTISLIEKNKAENIIANMKAEYFKHTSLEAQAFLAYPSQGVRQVFINE